MKRTKYAGEIRYREFVGCRVTLAMKLNVPTRFMVGDSNTIDNRIAHFINKKRGRELLRLEDRRKHLSAWVASKAWSESILRDAEIQDALTKLFHPDDKIRKQQSLSLDPLQLTYAYRMKSVDLEILGALIPPFLLVADKVARAKEPKEKLTLTTTGKLFIKHPFLAAILILVGVMFLLLVRFIL